GDGTGDRTRCADSVSPVAPVWQPGSLSKLALAAPGGRVQVYDVSTCRRIAQTPPGPAPTKLQWSHDGRLLLVVTPDGLRVLDTHGKVVSRAPGPLLDATFVGTAHGLATLEPGGDVRVGQQLAFHAPGLRQIVSSPDGRRLLLTWPAADQWVFVGV